MREIYEDEARNWELNRRLERDEEHQPRPQFALRPRRKQFRYWSGLSFQPTRPSCHTSPGGRS